MSYIGTQPNNVKKNTGIYNPNEILQLTKEGSWGGSMELIQSQTVSSAVAQVDFTSIKESKYDVHLLIWNNILCENDSKRIVMRFFESGTIETASVYHVAFQEYFGTSTFSEFRSTGISRIRVIENTGNDTAESGNAYHYFYNLGDSSKYSFSSGMTMGINTDANKIGAFGGGVLPQTSTVDGIQIGTYDVSSNFSATASLYGIKES